MRNKRVLTLILIAIGVMFLSHQLSAKEEFILLKGHKGGITAIAFFPQGRHAVSGDKTGDIRFWDVEEGKEIYRISSGSRINYISFSGDGRFMIYGSTDRTARIWHMKTGQELKTLRGHGGSVTCVAISRSGDLALTMDYQDGTVRLWDVDSGRKIGELKGHRGGALGAALAFLPDERHALSGSGMDKTVKIWDIKSLQSKATISLRHKGIILSMIFSPDGRYCISGDDMGEIKVWDLVTKGGVVSFEDENEAPIVALALHPDGSLIASGDPDGVITLWSIRERRMVKRFQALKDEVSALAFSPDGRYLASGSEDGSLKVWRMR